MIEGSRLGPYEIAECIGAGGMGEVWKARDTRLDRSVAIKVSRQQFTERFEREARAIAALNHPHICTLYDVGPDYLVMEYVEGQPLQGPLPLPAALRLAIQIANALDTAHRHGVVHRDLKPDNILVTKSGVKLLDFGLARLALRSAPAGEGTAAITLTQQGTVLGTPQYMSPEQVEGKEADARSDIFAFGAILYELITGKKAFEGKSAASVMAAVIREEPPPMPSLAGPLEPVVRRCLAKDPDHRWQNAADLKWALENLGTAEPKAARLQNSRLPWIAATSLAFLAAFAWFRDPAAKNLRGTFSIDPPPGAFFSNRPSKAVISPDGQLLLFMVGTPEKRSLWLRPLDSLEARQLPGTDGGTWPFWSPDSRSIAFFAQGKLKRLDMAGGSPQVVADAPQGRGGAWSHTGVIIFGMLTGGLQRVAAAGGIPEVLTATGSQELSHRHPHFLPDGNRFLYWSSSGNIYASSLDRPQESRRITESPMAAIYAPAGPRGSGHLLWVRGETLVAQPFDATSLRLEGEATPLADHIVQLAEFPGSPLFSVSADVLVYGAAKRENLQMTWLGRDGKRLGVTGPAGSYRGLSLSPDGTSVLLERTVSNNVDIWRFEFSRQIMTRLTFNSGLDIGPVWSRNGLSFAYASQREGGWGLFRKDSTGAGMEERLLRSVGIPTPGDWSPDGKYFLYTSLHTETGLDLWLLPLDGDRKPVPLLQIPFLQGEAQISPDGKWMAYVSDESGRLEVYIQPFPLTGGKWQVSNQGGRQPQWRQDGKELFYRASDSNLTAVKIETGSKGLQTTQPEALFQSQNYGVTADGQRFLVLLPTEDKEKTQFTAVLHWRMRLQQ